MGTLGSAASSTISSASGVAGAVISVKTLAVVIISASLLVTGLGIYSYVTQQDPLDVVESIFNQNTDPANPQDQNPTSSDDSDTDSEEGTSDIQTDQPTQSDQSIPTGQDTSLSGDPVSSGSNDYSSNDEYYHGMQDDNGSSGSDSSIEYEIP